MAPNVEVHRQVPQLAVLRHARVFVTHSGMGSAMESLHFEVPMVAIPQMAEQRANADRIAELGLGTVLPPGVSRRRPKRRSGSSTAPVGVIRKPLDFQAGIDCCGW